MKKFITLLFLSLFLAACGQADAIEHDNIFSSENVIVDVRSPEEFKQGHIKNAVNIQYNKIRTEIATIAPNKEQTIVVYCHSGMRSNYAARKLKDLGYTNVINAGKYDELKDLEEKQKK